MSAEGIASTGPLVVKQLLHFLPSPRLLSLVARLRTGPADIRPERESRQRNEREKNLRSGLGGSCYFAGSNALSAVTRGNKASAPSSRNFAARSR